MILEIARNKLEKVTINNKKLFYVEIDKEINTKLFFQLDFFKYLNDDAKFKIEDKEYKFFKYFSTLARRTGAHSPYGKIYYRNFIKLNDSIFNHEINA